MNRAIKYLFTFLIVALQQSLSAQNLGIGYYDLDALYDTSPSLFYNDDDYTPEGKYEWTRERYDAKVEGVAEVLDSMALPIVGLFGVENEGVVRRIVRSAKVDYSYVHRTRNSFDGLDFTLLYYADKLFVNEVTPLRNMLVIEAELDDETPLRIVLCRDGDDLASYLKGVYSDELTIVMGRLYKSEIEEIGFVDVLGEVERVGAGNYLSYRGWFMRDRIAVNQVEKVFKSGVFVAPFLLTDQQDRAQPTFDKGGYIGGNGRFLPIFMYLKRK